MISALLRRSWEDPRNPIGSDDDPVFLSGRKNAAGVRINRQTILRNSAIWAGARLLANDVAKLPVFVYRRGEGDAREIDRQHPAYRLIRKSGRANDYTKGTTLRKVLALNLVIFGRGPAWIERDPRTAAPVAIWPLDPAMTWPFRYAGALYLMTQLPNGERVPLEMSEVLNLTATTFDGVRVESVLDSGSESIGVMSASQEFAARFFGTGASPKLLLETTEQLKTGSKEYLQEAWPKWAGGLANAHKTVVLPKGVSVRNISHNSREAQMIQAREFGLKEAANWVGVPGHKVGDSSRTSYNSLEQENAAYLAEGLDTLLVEFEAEGDLKLLTTAQHASESHYVEFTRQALLRTSATERASYYRTMIEVGAMTPNEVRKLENLNPIEGGDEPRLGSGMTTAGAAPGDGSQDGDAAADDDGAAGRKDAIVDVIEHATGQFLRRLGTNATRAAKSTNNFVRWLDEFGDRHRPIGVESLNRAMRITGKDAAPVVDEILERFRGELLDASGKCTKNELGDVVFGVAERLALQVPADVAEAAVGDLDD